MAKFGVGKTVETLGDYLREQRLAASSCPCGSSPSRPACRTRTSARSNEGSASRPPRCSSSSPKALRVSAETLYVRAGILNLDDSEVRSVELAILADSGLTERQKQSLLDVYQSFRAANSHPSSTSTGGN